MAANFWASTHVDWLVTKQAIQESQLEDKIRGLGEHEIQLLKNHFCQFIVELARVSKLRQRVAATAVVYFRRFYLRSSFYQYDPLIVAPSCLYLASKAEESLVVAKHLVQYLKKQWPAWPYDTKDLLDYEMLVVELLDCSLVVFSPYHMLMQMLRSCVQLQELSQNAWACVNDLYRTDLPLRYPPHMLAIGCLHLVSIRCNRDIRSWLQALQVDIDQVYDIVSEMVDMYSKLREPISFDEAIRLLGIVRQEYGRQQQAQQQQQQQQPGAA